MSPIFKKQVRFFKQLLLFPPVSLVLFWALADLIIRRKQILSPEPGVWLAWSPQYLFFYGLSIIFSISWISFVSIFFRKIFLQFRITGLIASFFYLTLWSLFFIGSWDYFQYFQIIPNFYTFQYLAAEPEESKSIIYTALGFKLFLKVFIFASVSFLFFLRLLKPPQKGLFTKPIRPIINFLLIPILFLILLNNIRFLDQCLLPDVNTILTWSKVKIEKKTQEYFNRGGLHAGTRLPIKALSDTVQHNVLIHISESVRRFNLPVYGYKRETTPFFSKRLKENSDEYFVFRKAYANATSTMVAFPTLIVGGAATTPGLDLHRLPLLWDYGGAANCHTFLISSQIYYWRNFLTFVASRSLNEIWYKEISGHNPMDKRFFGIDDRFTVTRFLESVDKANGKNQPFFGVLHTYDTHYPYFAPNRLNQFQGPLGAYDNSIEYLDENFEKVVTHLKKIGQWEKTIVIFTSDHGEAFGEHGPSGHVQNLFLETLAIPFWIRIPRVLQKNWPVHQLRKNLNKPITNADLGPTLLNFMGLLDHPQAQNILNLLPGQSLFNSFPADRTFIFTNSTEFGVFRPNFFTSLIKENQLVHFDIQSGKPRFYFYDLATDSLSKKNLWKHQTEMSKRGWWNAFLDYPNTRKIMEAFKKAGALFPEQ